MKNYIIFWICILQIISTSLLSVHMGPACISLIKLNKATKHLCKNKNNAPLWKKVVDCHKPLTEEFMRASGEAKCPLPKKVANPTDTNHTIEDVFFNICGLVEGNIIQKLQGASCVAWTHYAEVAAIKETWGKEVPCNIGKCILKLGI